LAGIVIGENDMTQKKGIKQASNHAWDVTTGTIKGYQALLSEFWSKNSLYARVPNYVLRGSGYYVYKLNSQIFLHLPLMQHYVIVGQFHYA
jgi:hypothetical protein